MTIILERDARALRQALATDGDMVQVEVSRATAEQIAQWVEMQTRQQAAQADVDRAEVSPTAAAALMGMSRGQVHKLLDEGVLPFRMVGTHHRIRTAAITRWLEIEDARQAAAMAQLAELQNELGLVE